MKRLAVIAVLSGTLAAPAWADYDAALEAREAAQRKAAQQETARKKAEVARMKANAMNQYRREALGAEAKGKSDAEVKLLYDRKMAGINTQAAEATRMSPGNGNVDPARRADGEATVKNVTGKSMADLKAMDNRDAQALAREMQGKYGK